MIIPLTDAVAVEIKPMTLRKSWTCPHCAALCTTTLFSMPEEKPSTEMRIARLGTCPACRKGALGGQVAGAFRSETAVEKEPMRRVGAPLIMVPGGVR